MAKPDHFQYGLSKEIVAEFDHIARYGGSRGGVFHDFLRMFAAALTGGRDEPAYLDTVKRYTGDAGGERACDRIARAAGKVLDWYAEHPGGDLLGDIFQGGITYGEHGQFFTPEAVCELMSLLTEDGPPAAPAEPAARTEPLRVADPASGSGRILLTRAKRDKAALYFGFDVDERCVLMTALNLAFAGVRGCSVHCNSLTLESWNGWRFGWDGVGLLRRMTRAECLAVVSSSAPDPAPPRQPDPVPVPVTTLTPARSRGSSAHTLFDNVE